LVFIQYYQLLQGRYIIDAPSTAALSHKILHPPGNPVGVAVLKTAIKETHCTLNHRLDISETKRGCERKDQTSHSNFNVYGSVHRKYISIYISNKMQRYTIYLYLETALHVSGGTSTHHQERIQLYPQHLVFVTTPLLLPTAIAAGSSNGVVTNTRCCRYSCMRS
jgi:hypothetical protein